MVRLSMAKDMYCRVLVDALWVTLLYPWFGLDVDGFLCARVDAMELGYIIKCLGWTRDSKLMGNLLIVYLCHMIHMLH